jgi:molecular chaperone GrpE (heat shock protein)
LTTCAAGVASKAEALEGSLSASKDQLLRLTADFENFRKRTVSLQQCRQRRQGKQQSTG